MRAWELGIDHWDTADVYGDGQSERLIGELWGTVPREEIFLASKVGWDPGGYEHAYVPKRIRARCERSLELLRTETIDLYYLHHCDFGAEDRYLDGAVATLRELRREGKVRHIGLSDWDPDKVARYAPVVEPEVVQPYRNVWDDGYRGQALARWVEANDAGVAFFSPLKHGLLLGKYDAPTEFPAGDMRRHIPEFRDAESLAHLRDCRRAIEERWPEHPQAVLNALTGVLLADAPTSCVLLGLRNAAQVEAAAAAGTALSDDEAAWVRELYSRGR